MGGKIFPLLYLPFIVLLSFLIGNASSQDDRKSYVVYMGHLPKGGIPTSSIHREMLQKYIGSHYPPECLIRHFGRTFNGFVANLSETEAQKVPGIPGVVSVFPNAKKQLHTTRTWDFLGFSQRVPRSTFESDVIIGMLDTGIWPESQSFNDKGLGPPPKNWKGTCLSFSNFTCNRKIIGARYYRSNGQFPSGSFQSPRDAQGHGTHTSSTAAGGLVRMASLYGLALGTSRGAVPSARIAVYKVCWSDGCYDADILSAFDDAIADGVDIISISAGNTVAVDYFNDSIAIGSFHAMKHGILTSTSAGNSGPTLATISNVSPWQISVAASTIDRKFIAKVLLGNKKSYEGFAINTYGFKNAMYTIIYGANAPNTTGNFTSSDSRFCLLNSLDPRLVKGKVIVCDSVLAQGPSQSGAVGTLYRSQSYRDFAFSASMPISHVSLADGTEILSYVNSTRRATASIYRSRAINDTLAPYVASFSSRGPNLNTLDLIKPDISAPGVDILAAWSRVAPVSETQGDTRSVPYNIISGTSMACPHVTGAAAYVKSYHPNWSPSAIKSALMTTALLMSLKKNGEAEFAYGAGQVNPVKAINPGLVYDAETIDYINFLCGQGYNTSVLRLVTGDNNSCSNAFDANVWNLNYPSFGFSVSAQTNFSRVFTRTLTNVGSPRCTYRATVVVPEGLEIEVKPNVLPFTYVGQKLSFKLTIKGKISTRLVSTALIWHDGVNRVRSPITVFVPS